MLKENIVGMEKKNDTENENKAFASSKLYYN